MKRLLSEQNLAACLFVLVLVAFSFAHEDSKKRDSLYNASVPVNNSSVITEVPDPANLPVMENAADFNIISTSVAVK